MRILSEDENVRLIPVTWIKQYHFCPRIIYYLGVLGFTERVTESMAEGGNFISMKSVSFNVGRLLLAEEGRRLRLHGVDFT